MHLQIEFTIVSEEPSRELVKHCSLWSKNEKETLTWQFEHNNFQEYLAAKVLARQPLEVIKSFVSFEPVYSKTIPSWLNALTFLISIIDQEDPLFGPLFNWLKSIEPEIIVRFEIDKIDSSTRLTYFKQIFNECKEKEVTIDSEKFNYRALARFGQSNETVKFLLTEGEEAMNVATLKNANKGGIANAPHADFAGGVLTPPLTKGNDVPSGLPYFSIGDPAASWRGM